MGNESPRGVGNGQCSEAATGNYVTLLQAHSLRKRSEKRPVSQVNTSWICVVKCNGLQQSRFPRLLSGCGTFSG